MSRISFKDIPFPSEIINSEDKAVTTIETAEKIYDEFFKEKF